MNPMGDRGRMFTGDGPYRLSFPPGQLPAVDAFWSLTMYEATPDGQFFLVENPIRHYWISDRTPGLKTNADGSLAQGFSVAGRSLGVLWDQVSRRCAEAQPRRQAALLDLDSVLPRRHSARFQPPGTPAWPENYDG